ncbi:MAG: hypothetical protein AAB354_03120 [candidate division KSB1 bacterium]
MNVKPFIWLFVPLAPQVWAQDYNLGVRAQALGGSGVALATDPEGQFLNPATLAQVPGKTVTFSYSRPFGIKEITLSSVAASATVGKMALGVAAVHLGHAQFEDQALQLAGAIKVAMPAMRRQEARAFAVGMQSILRRVQIARYETWISWRVGAGLVAPLSEHVVWGAVVGKVLEVGREKSPRTIAFGVSYRAASRFFGQMDIFKQSDFATEVRAGAELLLLPPLLLRVGMGTNPDRFTVGLALALKPATLHFTSFSHFDLGWTQQYAATLKQ